MKPLLHGFLLALFLTLAQPGCKNKNSVKHVDSNDRDNDGYVGSADCDDTNFTIYPGAPETPCDYIDSDCDGMDNSASIQNDCPAGYNGQCFSSAGLDFTVAIRTPVISRLFS